MKLIASIFCLLFLSIISHAQEPIAGTIMHDNMERNYLLYVPNIYTGETAVPLLFNFHGYGSNATEQIFYGEFRDIADTENFILVCPEGALLNGTSHFNVGGWTLGSNVDDVGFTAALIEELSANYNIDEKRIYSTGMSNGGFMSFLLACQLSEKIAAVASVTGSMTPQTYSACNPQHPMPVMQIHGTDDSVVPYTGNILWTHSIDETVQYWIDFNNCDTIAEVTDMPDIDMSDQSTVEQFVYSDGFFDSSVEHYKITGGDHRWPGSNIPASGTNYDIDASHEIWRFFSKYDIDGLIQPTAVNNLSIPSIRVFPNPTASTITIDAEDLSELNFKLRNAFGGIVLSGRAERSGAIDISFLSAGIYFLTVDGQTHRVVKQ